MNKISDSRAEEVVRLYEKGLSFRQVTAITGVSKTTIKKYVQSRGLSEAMTRFHHDGIYIKTIRRLELCKYDDIKCRRCQFFSACFCKKPIIVIM